MLIHIITDTYELDLLETFLFQKMFNGDYRFKYGDDPIVTLADASEDDVFDAQVMISVYHIYHSFV